MTSSDAIDAICLNISAMIKKVQSDFAITPYDSYLRDAQSDLERARHHLRAYQRVALRKRHEAAE